MSLVQETPEGQAGPRTLQKNMVGTEEASECFQLGGEVLWKPIDTVLVILLFLVSSWLGSCVHVTVAIATANQHLVTMATANQHWLPWQQPISFEYDDVI